MKRGLLAMVSFFLVWIAPTALWADLTVHQVDKWTMAGAGTETTQRIVMYVKGGMVRIEQAQGRVAILRFPDKKLIELNPEERTYTEVSLETLQRLAELASGLIQGLEEITGEGGAKGAPGEGFHVVPTGQEQTISGFLCELHRVEGDDFSGDFWITQATDAGREFYPIQKEMAEFTKDMLPRLGQDVVAELERIGGTVIQFTARFQTPAGEVTVESLVEKLLQDPLPDDLFEPPADFSQKTDLKDPVNGDALQKGLEDIMKKLK